MAVIIEPTRELAVQVFDEITKFTKYLGDGDYGGEGGGGGVTVRHSLFIGGGSLPAYIRSLKAVNDAADAAGDDDGGSIAVGPHIVVGTPGVLSALVKKKALRVGGARFFVLDEADSMLETETLKDVMLVYDAACAQRRQRRPQAVVCSATLHSPGIAALAARVTTHAQWVE
jgi:superfamily II DNA/RNA helicase